MSILDRIVKPTDTITVSTVVATVYGDPGAGKTTTAQTCAAPLTLDFDGGIYRAKNRRDTLPIATWSEVEALLDDLSVLAGYETLVVDTVGRALDCLAADIIRKNPKHGSPSSGLSLQGFGALKARFATFVASLRRAGKDLVLLAHAREEKDGDVRLVRPDIQGASASEVHKLSDMIGYLHIRNGKRTIGWAGTDGYIAKNSSDWSTAEVPDVAKAPGYFAEVLADAKRSMSALSAESAAFAAEVEAWRAQVADASSADAVNALLPRAEKLPPIVKAQVRQLVADRVRALGLVLDKATKRYVDAAPAATEPAPAEVAA